MNVSFTYAYDSLKNLREKDDKVAILFSPRFNRVKELIDFFETHSGFTVNKMSLSEIARYVAPDGVNTPFGATDKIFKLINKRQKPEYLIIDENADLPDSFLAIDELCNVIREIGKRIPVVIVSENSGEFSLLYGPAVMIDVPCLNEKTLKISPSTLGIEELYLRNNCEAMSSGVFLSNKKFFEKFLEKKIEGDKLFEQEKYVEAFAKYNDAISFHVRYKSDCPINDFIGLSLYIRFVASYYYGHKQEDLENEIYKYRLENIDSILSNLKKSKMMDRHGKMIKDYEFIFLGIKGGWLERTNYLLFLKEYIF